MYARSCPRGNALACRVQYAVRVAAQPERSISNLSAPITLPPAASDEWGHPSNHICARTIWCFVSESVARIVRHHSIYMDAAHSAHYIQSAPPHTRGTPPPFYL